MSRHLWHLTLLTGHVRERSPLAEVAPTLIARLRPIVDAGGGPLWDTGWGVLVVERSADGAVYDLSSEGVEIARCWLALAPDAEARFWSDASASPTLPGVKLRKPGMLPWLAAGLLPDGMALLRNLPERMLELGDLERCVAWVLAATG